MGAGDNSFLFREDFRSGGDRPPKPTLFERFKLWREGGDAPASKAAKPAAPGPTPVPRFTAAAPLAGGTQQQLPRSGPSDNKLETDFRDAFSSRLEEICEGRTGGDRTPVATVGAAQPAGGGLFLHEVAAEGRAGQNAAIGQVSGSFAELPRLLEGIHDRLSETSRRGAEVQDLLADLPDVVQALPAIGRGQLSILSDISSEQRAIGAETGQQFERQIERVHDLAGAIGTVQERTTEVVRSVDELREVLGVLPGSLQAQAEMLDLTRRNLEGLQTQGMEESARLLAGFERQEDVFIEGFVHQTVAMEGVRDGLSELARTLKETSEQEAAEREAEIVRPNWSRGWRGTSFVATAAAFLVMVGFGVAFIGQSGDSSDLERTEAFLAGLEGERTLLKEQMGLLKDSLRESADVAETERADYMNRLANVMELTRQTTQVNSDLENDLEVLTTRLKRLDNENRALRALGSAARQANAADVSTGDREAE